MRRTREKRWNGRRSTPTPARHRRGDVGARQQAIAFGGADRKAREVVVALDVHAGHLRRLAAHQRTTGATAAFGDAGHDTTTRLDVEPAAGVIVEEEQRLGALHHDVVDAHRHQVDADVSGTPASIATLSLVPTRRCPRRGSDP